MTKIVFIVLGELANGEVTIAFEFASRLPKDKYETCFIIPEKSKHILDERGMKNFALNIHKKPEENKKRIDQFLDEMKPDFFIVSDVFTMEYAYIWSGLNFQGLMEYGVKIIGIDEFDYLDAGYTVDYYGEIMKELPALLDKCDFIIRSCPLSEERERRRDNVRYFSLYKEKLKISKEEKNRIKSKLGIPEEEKMILIVLSRWETINIYRLPALGAFQKWMPIMLRNYLNALNKKVHLVHLSPEPWGDMESENLNYQYFSYLPPLKYDECLLACDLFLTFNLVSVSLAKAIFGSVPSMVFQNYKCIDYSKLSSRLEQLPEWYREMAEEVKIVYPFKASVFGWDRLLQTTLKDNGYKNSYIEVPFLKMNDVIKSFQDYLFNDEAIKDLESRQEKFVEKVLKLPTPDEIIQDFIESSKEHSCLGL